MSTLVLLAALAAAPTEETANEELRRFHDILRDMRVVLRKEVRAKSKADRAAAIHELTELYGEIRRDPRLDTSDTLAEYKAKIWSRLTRVKKDLQRELARDAKRPDGKSKSSEQDSSHVDPTTASLADSLALLSLSGGGPAAVFSRAQGSRGGGAIPDYGPELVELIERTIAPEFWDSAGGPGSIFYYKPLRVLVVRATDEVHHKLGGTVEALRRASR